MSTNDVILIGAGGALHRLPRAVAQPYRLEREQVGDLIRLLTDGRGDNPDVARLLSALSSAEVEAQGFNANVALPIAALFASAPADAQERPVAQTTITHVSSPEGAVAVRSTPAESEAVSIGQSFALHGRTLRVRNVEAVAHYRDQGGVTRHPDAGGIFIRVRYEERNDGAATPRATTLAQVNYGDRDSVRAGLSEFPVEASLELSAGQSRMVTTTFDVPRAWLGKTVVLFFVGARVDPMDASDTEGMRSLRLRGDASRVAVEIQAHVSP